MAVAIGDLNRDGKPDLVVADYNGNTVSVLLGNGDGTFGSPTTYAAGDYPYSVGLADLNGDGSFRHRLCKLEPESSDSGRDD